MGEIIPSEALSYVTYTGINSIHSEKTKQPYIRSARKNRTRKKKSAVEEDPRKFPRTMGGKRALRIAEINREKALEKEISISKKQPCKFLRTESLNTRRPKNKS